jgi:hypothetical protein
MSNIISQKPHSDEVQDVAWTLRANPTLRAGTPRLTVAPSDCTSRTVRIGREQQAPGPFWCLSPDLVRQHESCSAQHIFHANEFLVIGSRDAQITFSTDKPGPPIVGIESIDEEFFENGSVA